MVDTSSLRFIPERKARFMQYLGILPLKFQQLVVNFVLEKMKWRVGNAACELCEVIIKTLKIPSWEETDKIILAESIIRELDKKSFSASNFVSVLQTTATKEKEMMLRIMTRRNYKPESRYQGSDFVFLSGGKIHRKIGHA